MSRESDLKKLVHSIFAAADAGDVESALSFFSPSYVDHTDSEARQVGGSDYERVAIAFSRFAEAFPDTRHTIHDLIAEGDRLAVRVSAVGTHTGALGGLAPTGRTIRNDSIAIYRVETGKIVERWCRERQSILAQLRNEEG